MKIRLGKFYGKIKYSIRVHQIPRPFRTNNQRYNLGYVRNNRNQWNIFKRWPTMYLFLGVDKFPKDDVDNFFKNEEEKVTYKPDGFGINDPSKNNFYDFDFIRLNDGTFVKNTSDYPELNIKKLSSVTISSSRKNYRVNLKDIEQNHKHKIKDI